MFILTWGYFCSYISKHFAIASIFSAAPRLMDIHLLYIASPFSNIHIYTNETTIAILRSYFDEIIKTKTFCLPLPIYRYGMCTNAEHNEYSVFWIENWKEVEWKAKQANETTHEWWTLCVPHYIYILENSTILCFVSIRKEEKKKNRCSCLFCYSLLHTCETKERHLNTSAWTETTKRSFMVFQIFWKTIGTFSQSNGIILVKSLKRINNCFLSFNWYGQY